MDHYQTVWYLHRNCWHNSVALFNDVKRHNFCISQAAMPGTRDKCKQKAVAASVLRAPTTGHHDTKENELLDDTNAEGKVTTVM